MLGVPKNPAPIARYVVGDLALFGVPFKLFVACCVAGLPAAFIVGLIRGNGIEPMEMVVVVPLLCWRVRTAYLRDRHVENVWRVRFSHLIGRADVPFQPGWKGVGPAGSSRRVGA